MAPASQRKILEMKVWLLHLLVGASVHPSVQQNLRNCKDYEYRLKMSGTNTDYVQFSGVLGNSNVPEIDVSMWFRTTSSQNLWFFTYVAPNKNTNELALVYNTTNSRFITYVDGQADRYVYPDNYAVEIVVY